MIKIYIFLVMQTYLLGMPATVVVEHPTYTSCEDQREELILSFPGYIESITCEYIEERGA